MKKALLLVFTLIFSIFVLGETLTLTLASFGSYDYFHALLKESLEQAGHKVIINKLGDEYEQKRVLSMLDNDEKITLHWLVKNAERDSKYIPVDIGLTNGLVGKRILFIPKNRQNIYNNVKTLQDFRSLNLVGGFGKGWFDVNVWKTNGLKYTEKDGSWDPEIYNMVAAGNRDIDYFSRGANEIAAESDRFTNLDIEKNLILQYDRDFIFYLSKSNAKLKPILESALKKAKENGLINKLLRMYYPEIYDKSKINLDGRITIKLDTPK